MNKGAQSWFHNVSTYGYEVIIYWIFIIENLFKSKQNFIGEFGGAFGIGGKSLMSKIWWGDLEIFRLEVWEILIF